MSSRRPRGASHGRPRRPVPHLPPSYPAYVVEAIPDPEPGIADHVLLRIGIGELDEAPSAYVELCSHSLPGLVDDLRTIVAAARREGKPVMKAAGDLDYAVGERVT